MSINLHIRQAVRSDAAVLEKFNLRLARETESLRLEPAVVHRGIARLFDEPERGIYFVAELEGQVVGQSMITYEWSDWRNGNIWWLQSVYVLAEHRRRGVFRALYAHIVNEARRDEGVVGLRLYMHGTNATARASYERLGMKGTEYQVFEHAFGNHGE